MRCRRRRSGPLPEAGRCRGPRGRGYRPRRRGGSRAACARRASPRWSRRRRRGSRARYGGIRRSRESVAPPSNALPSGAVAGGKAVPPVASASVDHQKTQGRHRMGYRSAPARRSTAAGRSAARSQTASALLPARSRPRVAVNRIAFMPSACGPRTSLYSRSPTWSISLTSTPSSAAARLKMSGCGFERPTLVGERERAEVVEQAMALQPFAQTPARRVDRVGDHRKRIAGGKGLDGVADPGDRVRHDFKLHLLDPGGDAGQNLPVKLPAEPAEQHREPIRDRPGHLLIVPDLRERGVGDVVGGIDDLRRHRGMDGEGVAHQRPARLPLRGQPGRGAFGLVRIVMDDRIPQVEADRTYHGAFPLEATRRAEAGIPVPASCGQGFMRRASSPIRKCLPVSPDGTAARNARGEVAIRSVSTPRSCRTGAPRRSRGPRGSRRPGRSSCTCRSCRRVDRRSFRPTHFRSREKPAMRSMPMMGRLLSAGSGLFSSVFSFPSASRGSSSAMMRPQSSAPHS